MNDKCVSKFLKRKNYEGGHEQRQLAQHLFVSVIAASVALKFVIIGLTALSIIMGIMLIAFVATLLSCYLFSIPLEISKKYRKNCDIAIIEDDLDPQQMKNCFIVTHINPSYILLDKIPEDNPEDNKQPLYYFDSNSPAMNPLVLADDLKKQW